ncbi:MAG: hypothetical protein JWM59_5074 [Verrucomicrobiales bacterium]|nr:hypothetical protein [Verrucomicrobiales bacterium]
MKKIVIHSIATLVLAVSSLQASEPSEQDRKAILSMAGQFAVNFTFHETLSLQKGYEMKTSLYDEDAHELVVVAEDTPRRIALQHLLVVGDKMVIKHWAQIWTYEDTRICDFQGNNSWKMRDITPGEAEGKWTQLVTQVDDSPRYEGLGRWVHRGEISEWESGETPRPLPRREHTKRKDYEILGGINRHTITPNGWAHEQDNTKLQLRDGKQVPLAREAGLNTYKRVTDFDFQAARDFWSREAPFWSTVNAAWTEVQNQRNEFAIKDGFDVPGLRKAIDEVQEQQQRELRVKITGVISGFLDAKPGAAAAAEVKPAAPAAEPEKPATSAAATAPAPAKPAPEAGVAAAK